MTYLRIVRRAVLGVALLLLSGAVGTAFGQNVYVIFVPNLGGANVSGYVINETSGPLGGTLTPTTGSPYGLGLGGNFPARTAVTNPDHKFLYTANNNGTVSLFKINPDGSLTAIGTPTVVTAASGITIDNTSSPQHLYVANMIGGSDTRIYGFSINPATGSLTALAGSPYAVTAGQQGAQSMLVVGGYVYVVEQTSNSIQVMSIGAGGALSPSSVVASQFPAGEQPLDIKTDGAGHIYVTDYTAFLGLAPPVAAFSISGGTLTPIATYSGGDNPLQMAVANTTSGNNYLYVANSGDFLVDPSIAIYKINANGTLGAPTVVTTSVPAEPSGIAVDLSNQFLHVTDGSGGAVWAYKIDQTTGLLTPRGSIAAGTTPYFLSSTIAPPPGAFTVPAASTWSLILLGVVLAAILWSFSRKPREKSSTLQ